METYEKRNALKDGSYVLSLDGGEPHPDRFEFLDVGFVAQSHYGLGFVIVRSLTVDRYYFADIDKIIPLLGQPK